jgi:amidohydrolase
MPALATLAVLATALASPAAPDLDAAVARATPTALELRHRIRQNPELSNREFETAKLVAKRLKALGYEVRTGVARTGVIGVLKGGRPGATVVAVRADMDALPVVEQTDLPFRSTKRTTFGGQEVGVAHACGHDVHTSVELGLAEVLAELRPQLAGTVVLVFQPAEEGSPPGEEGGAKLMVDEGFVATYRPSAMFALHSFPEWEVGTIAFHAGPIYASSDTWRATIHGKQAHGAYPHLSVDPIVMAAQAIEALQTIRSRNLDPSTPGVVTVGVVRGGERFNIIPEKVELEGTVRAYSVETQDLVERRMREVLGGITAAGGGSYELHYARNNPVTVNHPALTAWARGRLTAALGAERVATSTPRMGAEDFAWFAQQVPGFYFQLGVTKPGTVNSGLHTPTFRPDDGAVEVGIRAMATLVVDYLAAPPALDAPPGGAP